MLTAYWQKEGIELYRLAKGRVDRIAGGPLSQLNAVRGFGKRLLVIGRDRLLHTRKRYPSASYENIQKAVLMDLGELFPLKDPCHAVRIFEKTDNYTLVDVWAWDCSEYAAVRSVFPFTHVLPEDLSFAPDEPEISIFGKDGIVHFLACSKDRFLGVSTKKGDVTPQSLNLFLKGLGRHAGEIKRINFYGTGLTPEDLKGSALDISADMVFREYKTYPVFLDSLGKLDLRELRYRSALPLRMNMESMMRTCIYLLVAYGFFLFLTTRNYDAAIEKIRLQTDGLNKTVESFATGSEKEDYADMVKELDERSREGTSPLHIMNVVASHLPDKSFVTKMVLEGNKAELSLASAEPLKVISSLGAAREIGQVRLKGAPGKDTSGIYHFAVSIQMK